MQKEYLMRVTKDSQGIVSSSRATSQTRIGQSCCPAYSALAEVITESCPVLQQSPPTELRFSLHGILSFSRAHQLSHNRILFFSMQSPPDWAITDSCPPAEPTSRAQIEPPQNPVLQQSSPDELRLGHHRICPPVKTAKLRLGP